MTRSFDKLADKAFKPIRKTFNTPTEWLPKSGGRFNILCIFDDNTVLVDPDTEQPISSNLFTLGIRFADVAEYPVKGDKARVNGKLYRVIEVKEDGVEGVSGVLILHKVK